MTSMRRVALLLALLTAATVGSAQQPTLQPATLTPIAVLNQVIGGAAAAAPELQEVIARAETGRARLTAPPAQPTRNIVRVHSGDNLQAVLDAAQPGDEIRVDPRSLFVGAFRIKTSGTQGNPITLRTDADLPERRLTRDDADKLFGLRIGALATESVLSFAKGVHDWQVVGMRVFPNTAQPSRALVTVGAIDKTTKTLDDLPQRITFDRVLVEGDATLGGRRGLAVAARDLTITRSWISDFVYAGRDSQAIFIYAGRGFTVTDNQLEASGENLLVGGADVATELVMPQDILIVGNTMYKPAYYKTRKGTVKNGLELKSGLRVRIEGNILDGCWKDAQPGSILLLTTRNQEHTNPWSQIADVVIRGNIVKNVEASAWLNILSLDDQKQADGTLVPSRELTNLLVEHNFATNITDGVRIGYGGRNFVFRHNTQIPVKGWALQFHGPKDASTGKPVYSTKGFTWTDNVSGSGVYGTSSEYGVTIGAPTLAVAVTDMVWSRNAIELTAARTIKWPPGTVLLPPGTLAGQVDAATGQVVAGSVLAGHPGIGVDPAKLRH